MGGTGCVGFTGWTVQANTLGAVYLGNGLVRLLKAGLYSLYAEMLFYNNGGGGLSIHCDGMPLTGGANTGDVNSGQPVWESGNVIYYLSAGAVCFTYVCPPVNITQAAWVITPLAGVSPQ